MSAVVLNYRTPDDTRLAVKSLLASRRRLDEIIVVNNAPEDDCEMLQTLDPAVVWICTGGNLGFSGGVNVGIRRALDRGADRVLVVNSDVIVPPDCVERLEAGLDARSHAGIAGPVILSRCDPEHVASLGISYAASTGRMTHAGVADGATAVDRRHNRPVDAVSGCLMLVDRRVLEAVGLFDEDYFFSFEDLDLCLRARRSGFETILVAGATAYHEGSRSIGPASAERLYFAARNHLLLARRADSTPAGFGYALRLCSIVALNVAYALRSRSGRAPQRFLAVVRGTRDYFSGRFGAGSAAV